MVFVCDSPSEACRLSMHVAAQQQQQQALHSPTAHGWAICSKHTADPTLDTTTWAAVEEKKKKACSSLPCGGSVVA